MVMNRAMWSSIVVIGIFREFSKDRTVEDLKASIELAVMALECGETVAALDVFRVIRLPSQHSFVALAERQSPDRILCFSVAMAHLLQQSLLINSSFGVERSKRGMRPTIRGVEIGSEQHITFETFRLFILDTYIQGRRQQYRFIRFRTTTASRFGGGTRALSFPSRGRIALVSSMRAIINRLLLAQRICRWWPVRLQVSDRVFAL